MLINDQAQYKLFQGPSSVFGNSKGNINRLGFFVIIISINADTCSVNSEQE